MQYFFLKYQYTILVVSSHSETDPVREHRPSAVTGVTEFTAALKRCLKARGMTYAGLAPHLGLSEQSVKRLFSSGGFTLERIEQICRLLDMDLFELARHAQSEAATATELTIAQEQALAQEPRLLLVFHLLLSGWRPAEIVEAYDLSDPQCITALAKLDRLRLIDLTPGNEVRLRTARLITWRRNGPIRRAYQERVLHEFFDARFESPGELLQFEAKELSRASRDVIRRKFERLIKEFNELATLDADLKPTERESMGLVIGLRPYVLSLFTRMQRRKRR